MKIASNKKWITVAAAVLMVCVCALASAQSYSLGDEADEIGIVKIMKPPVLFLAADTFRYCQIYFFAAGKNILPILQFP